MRNGFVIIAEIAKTYIQTRRKEEQKREK